MSTPAVPLIVLLRAVQALEAVKAMDLPGFPDLYMLVMRSHAELSYQVNLITATQTVEVHKHEHAR